MSKELFEAYSHKLKTLDKLKANIGNIPRDKKVVMCHGVFDVIHPGHLRHLIYAKQKADILVVSMTADTHIKKGIYRPHVPQSLRALNMAAFEIVDYVIIDNNATPHELLGAVKPDFFAKGYEYGEDGEINPKTQEEIEILETFGGQLIFTPGDYVYSSSKLITMAPPDLSYDKLSLLLRTHGVTIDDLRDTLNKFTGRKIHIVGDTIVDSFTRCSMIGGQTKTPTMSVLFQEREDLVGGAGIVAKHMNAAGGDVTFSTVLGNDSLKDFVLEDFKDSGVKLSAYVDELRPTTNKNAITVGGYRLLKVDTLDNATIPQLVLSKLVEEIKNTDAEAVVFSDFRHGVFNSNTITALTRAIPIGKLRVGDSQVASRWGNVCEFQGFDLITPNEREARFTTADQDSGIRPLASKVYDEAKCKNLILKLGDKGVLCCHNSDHNDPDSFFMVDSFVDQLKDAVGAGDALLAYSTLALLVSKNIVHATILGSIAAAVECEFDGNYPVTPNHVIKKLEKLGQTL